MRAVISMLVINSDYEVQVFKTLQPYLLLQGGFSNGYFIYTSDTFDINKQGVVSLRKDVTLDRETKDNYILQVQTLFYVFYFQLFPVFNENLHILYVPVFRKCGFQNTQVYIFNNTKQNKSWYIQYTLNWCIFDINSFYTIVLKKQCVYSLD